MGKRVQSWEVSDDFWQRVEPLVPLRMRLPGKVYLCKAGAGRPGISGLKDGSPVAQRISSALKSGVKVVACQNTMTARHLSNADTLADIATCLRGG